MSIRLTAQPESIEELFLDVFDDFVDPDMYDHRDKLALIWACAMLGRKTMKESVGASGVFFEVAVRASRRAKSDDMRGEPTNTFVFGGDNDE